MSEFTRSRMKGVKGQVTVFIIVAIVIVGAVIGFFIFRNSNVSSNIPANLEPAYTAFVSCLEADTSTGIDVLESQAGYITPPNFEAGSAYMPFSSQLNFLGNSIPYWYYVSGNNFQRENVPSKTEMENQLGEFIDGRIRDCYLDDYYNEGFGVVMGDPKAEVKINDNDVEVNLGMNLVLSKGNDTAVVANHKVTVDSKLGTLYDSAMKVYDYEQKSLFLEEHAVDVLRLYAPVDGVEITCSPLIWSGSAVFDKLKNATEANTLALKVKGSDYSLNSKDDEYFVIDVPSIASGVNVRFLNSKDWPNSFEVNPSDGSLMLAQPVGNQPGLGILGFCYVPYHFVYNVRYPVLVQVSDAADKEIFQFPVAVVLQGNLPRKALNSSAVDAAAPELCAYKNTPVTVNTYDTKLNPVAADISYECFNEVCSIGNTGSSALNNSQGSITANFPQCVNGRIVAKADGFRDAKYLYSTTEAGSVDIIMDRVYDLNVDLSIDGKPYNSDAVINFISDDSSKTVVYPQQKTVELSEGQYEVQVYAYKNTSIKLDATTKQQCMEVPQTGIGGLVGLTEQQCYSIDIPSQVISNALSGGGKQNYYMLESELSGSSTIEINAESLPAPTSLDKLQDNYQLFEEKGLDINFK